MLINIADTLRDILAKWGSVFDIIARRFLQTKTIPIRHTTSRKAKAQTGQWPGRMANS